METDSVQVLVAPWAYYIFALIPVLLEYGFKCLAVWFIAKVCWLIVREICSASVDREKIYRSVVATTDFPEADTSKLERLMEKLNARQDG